MERQHKINYRTILPPPALVPYVKFYWVLEGENIRRSSRPYIYRSMADGGAEIIFHYKGYWNELTGSGEEKCFISGINGPARHFRRFKIQDDFGIFGVYLYACALPELLSYPADELSDQMPNMDTLLHGAGKELEEKIMLCASNEERAGIMSEFFLNRLVGKPADDRLCLAVREMVQRKGQVDINRFASDYHLSLRQFQRKFKRYSGFSPKLYSRILRFGDAMNKYGKGYKRLTDIAYDCGYYDQSHFIHDFKSFSGFHPRQYFSGKVEGIEWREE